MPSQRQRIRKALELMQFEIRVNSELRYKAEGLGDMDRANLHRERVRTFRDIAEWLEDTLGTMEKKKPA